MLNLQHRFHMKSDRELSRRERQIMDILHASGEAGASEVLVALPDPPSYSAIRALLRILEEKGHATHREADGRYLYRPRASRQAASRSALQRVVSTFFAGSVTGALAALLDAADGELPAEEIRRLRDIIERSRKGTH